jgi:hypothetical protein
VNARVRGHGGFHPDFKGNPAVAGQAMCNREVAERAML